MIRIIIHQRRMIAQSKQCIAVNFKRRMPLKTRIKRAYILPEAKHSDHCPIVVEIE